MFLVKAELILVLKIVSVLVMYLFPNFTFASLKERYQLIIFKKKRRMIAFAHFSTKQRFNVKNNNLSMEVQKSGGNPYNGL